MALVDTSGTWTAITLTKDEIWFAQIGPFKVHCLASAAPSENDGATIRAGDSIRFQAGQTVYHRADDGQEGRPGQFARVEVAA